MLSKFDEEMAALNAALSEIRTRRDEDIERIVHRRAIIAALYFAVWIMSIFFLINSLFNRASVGGLLTVGASAITLALAVGAVLSNMKRGKI